MVTAKEFYNDSGLVWECKGIPEKDNTEIGDVQLTMESLEQLMIDFAKLHVKAALEAASKNAKANNGGTYRSIGGHLSSNPAYVDRDSILNCYPESNIK